MSYREDLIPTELLRGEFLQDNAVTFTSVFLVGVIAYTYRVALGRILDPAAFGLVATLLSMYHLLGVSHALSDRNATLLIADDPSDERVGSALIGSVTLSVALVGTLFVLRTHVANFLDVPVALVFVVLVGAAAGTINTQGILQTFYEFTFIGAARVLVRVLVVIVSVLGVLWTDGVVEIGFALAGIVLYDVLTRAIFLQRVLGSHLERVRYSREKLVSFYRELPSSSLYFGIIAVPTSVDMILVNHYFSGVAVGVFGLLTVFGQAYLMVSRSVAFVMFPKASRSRSIHELVRGLGVALPFVVAGTVVGAVFPQFWVVALFGTGYYGAVAVLPLYLLAMAVFALAAIVLAYLVASKRNRSAVVVNLALLLQIPLIVLDHGSLHAVVYNVMVCYVIALLLGVSSVLFVEYS